MKFFSLLLGIVFLGQTAAFARPIPQANLGVYAPLALSTSGSCETRDFEYTSVHITHNYTEPYSSETGRIVIDMFIRADGSAKLDVLHYVDGKLENREWLNLRWYMDGNKLGIVGLGILDYVTIAGKPGISLDIQSGLAKKLHLQYTNLDAGTLVGSRGVWSFASDITVSDCNFLKNEILN